MKAFTARQRNKYPKLVFKVAFLIKDHQKIRLSRQHGVIY